MFLHDSPSHLWYNMLSQLTFAWFASFHHHGIGGHFEILLVYLLAGFGGGVAFKVVEKSSSQIRLVGCSAGVFGLAGLCLLDSLVDGITYLWKKYRKKPNSEEMNYEYQSLNQSFATKAKGHKKRMIFIARTLCVLIQVAFDCYGAITGPHERRMSVLVHFAGFVSGIVIGLLLLGFRHIYSLFYKCGKISSDRRTPTVPELEAKMMDFEEKEDMAKNVFQMK